MRAGLMGNKLLILGIGLVAVAATAGWKMLQPSTPAPLARPLETVVTKANLEQYVTERGVVIPARISPIASQISSNQAKIVWLIKEGSQVKEGDIVARFDTKPFLDALEKAEQAHGDAVATFAAAEKLLSLQEEEEQGKIEEAIRKQEIVGIEANDIRNGSGPLKRKVFEQKLHQAERTVEIAEDELRDLQTLLDKGHISLRERDKAQDRLATAREELLVARAEIENFDTYAWPQMLRQAELLVGGALSDLERVRRTAELLIQNRQAEVEKSRRAVVTKEKALEAARQDVKNCDIFAPTAGIVLYATLPRDNGKRKIQIGDSVWVGQTFLQVPDTTALVAELQIREIDVAKISAGMAAEIVVDAFPGQVFDGRVENIASLAGEDENSPGIRRFPARITFQGDTGNVHVGMSVTVKVVYASRQAVLTVPVSALVSQGQESFVIKKQTDGGRTKVAVVPGLRGPLQVEIVAGLAEGDVVFSEALR